jgi:deoxyribose-phosphate aldolase
MLAGADFVKTSTGKVGTPTAVATASSSCPNPERSSNASKTMTGSGCDLAEASWIICSAIRDFHAKTGRKVGFKVAGGVKTANDAALYYTIVEQVLGPEWLTPRLFRIGASSLQNALISAIGT